MNIFMLSFLSITTIFIPPTLWFIPTISLKHLIDLLLFLANINFLYIVFGWKDHTEKNRRGAKFLMSQFQLGFNIKGRESRV